MRVELIGISHPSPATGHTRLARVRTPLGEVTARWAGDPAAEPGEYQVEWTVDEDLVWGRNAEAAAPEDRTGVREGGHGTVVLWGWLDAEEDGSLVLRLGEALVQLDAAGVVPGGVMPGWVRLRLDRGQVVLYPYHL